MNAVYLFLLSLGWFFLLAWVVMLLGACAAAFRGDTNPRAHGPRTEDPTINFRSGRWYNHI